MILRRLLEEITAKNLPAVITFVKRPKNVWNTCAKYSHQMETLSFLTPRRECYLMTHQLHIPLSLRLIKANDLVIVLDYAIQLAVDGRDIATLHITIVGLAYARVYV